MPTPFMSSEEYDERAHALYNEGQFDEALEVLREGLTIYPQAVELLVGLGYARMAREEFAWARKSFEEALVLDPEHEDGLAGLGETLLKFGQIDLAQRAFDRTVVLGYDDDLDLMLQIGRALFRESLVDSALAFFERAVAVSADSSEAAACVGYALHRLGREEEAIVSLKRALELDPEFGEARVYLANIMYDRAENEEALTQFEKTTPEDHWDELGIWRLIELKRETYRLAENDGELKPWEDRLTELAGEPDAVDELLSEIEQKFMDEEGESVVEAQSQLETLGSLFSTLNGAEEQSTPVVDVASADMGHRVLLQDGRTVDGTWEEIVQHLRDERNASLPLEEFMYTESRRQYGATGAEIPTRDAEGFIRGSADAGLLRIVR